MNNLDDIAYTVGTALRDLRKNAGYKSYEQFAYEHKISRIQYWKMENGNNFTLKSLLTVLNAHKIDLPDFLTSILQNNTKETEDSLRLKKILNHTKRSKKEFAKQLGYKNLNILNHVFLGRNKISDSLARKIVKHYPEMNQEWILTGKGKFITPQPTLLE